MKKPVTAFPLQDGGGVLAASADPASLAVAAAQRGLACYIADCNRARSRSAVLRAIAKAVDSPEYFGGDFDALLDCLCDTIMDQKNGGILLLCQLHSGDPVLADDAVQIESMCQDLVEFARDNGRFFYYQITHAGRHPDPEPGKVTSWSAEVQ